MTNPLSLLTPEQRAENIRKAQEARRRRAAERAASTLRRDFRDMAHWEDVARQRGMELPPFGEPPTPNVMRAFLKKAGVSVSAYCDWAGETRLTDFAIANPTWPARAWAGIVLERFAA